MRSFLVVVLLGAVACTGAKEKAGPCDGPQLGDLRLDLELVRTIAGVAGGGDPSRGLPFELSCDVREGSSCELTTVGGAGSAARPLARELGAAVVSQVGPKFVEHAHGTARIRCERGEGDAWARCALWRGKDGGSPEPLCVAPAAAARP